MKTYVIHEVSNDNLAAHLSENNGSKLLAVIPENLDNGQLTAVLSNVFKVSSPSPQPKFPAPSTSLTRQLNGNTLSSKLLLAFRANPGKAMKPSDFMQDSNFSDFYTEEKIKKALYNLSYSKKLRVNGSGKYSLR